MTLKLIFQEQCNSESTAERLWGERNLVSMHTAVDSGTSKFVDAMLFGTFMQINYHQYKSGVWNHLGISISLANPGSLCCQFGTLVSDPDHPHSCVHLGGERIGRYVSSKADQTAAVYCAHREGRV